MAGHMQPVSGPGALAGHAGVGRARKKRAATAHRACFESAERNQIGKRCGLRLWRRRMRRWRRRRPSSARSSAARAPSPACCSRPRPLACEIHAADASSRSKKMPLPSRRCASRWQLELVVSSQSTHHQSTQRTQSSRTVRHAPAAPGSVAASPSASRAMQIAMRLSVDAVKKGRHCMRRPVRKV